MNIGKAIKELRKNKQLSQEELAELAGIRQASLSQIENGQRPGPQTLKKLSEALGVPESMIYILGLEKEDVPANKQMLYDELFPIIQSLVMKIGE